jgi:putative ABC transport system ATP-binding protein
MGKTEVTALRGVDLEIGDGEFVAIMGPSGSGKSTMMHILGALDRPDEGEIYLGERNAASETSNGLAELRGKKIGFVFQTFSLIETLSARENVELAMMFQGVSRRRRGSRAAELLERVGLSDRAGHRPSELSGGQQQRVAIARALANDPEILLADEPTGNLDSKSGKQIMDLLRNLNREKGMTIVLVTHDASVATYADRVIELMDGAVASDRVVHTVAGARVQVSGGPSDVS